MSTQARSFAASVLSCSLLLGGCNEQDDKTVAPVSAPPTAISPKAAEPPSVPPPQDLNVSALHETLKCDDARRSEVCRVLERFQEAKRWQWRKPAGTGRWIGRAYTVAGGVEQESLMLLWAQVIPTAQAGPGELPMRVGIGEVPERLTLHGNKLLRARTESRGPSPKNQAAPFVESFEPATTWSAMQSKGESILAVAGDATYVRELDRRVYFIQRDERPTSQAGDGIYAELWIATW